MAANDWEVVSRTPFTPPTETPVSNEWAVISRTPLATTAKTLTAPAAPSAVPQLFLPPDQQDPQEALQRAISDEQQVRQELARLKPEDVERRQILEQEILREQQRAQYYRGVLARGATPTPAAPTPTKPAPAKPVAAQSAPVADTMAGFDLTGITAEAGAGPSDTVLAKPAPGVPAPTTAPKKTTQGLDISAMPEQFKSGVAGMQQSYFTTVAKSAAEALNLMDRIDRGEKLPPAQDPLGYQDMSPEQRAKVREQYQRVLSANVAKIISYGAEQQGYVKNPNAEALVQAANKGDWRGAWKALSNDPAGVIQQFSVQSAPNVLPSLVGGAAGVLLRGGLPALMTGLATGSFPIEYMSSLVDSLQDSGVDLKDAKAVEAKLRDPAFLEAAGKKAVTRGAVIATADALSGRLLMPMKAGQLGKNIKRGAANIAIEPSLEATGEAVAQAATGEWKPGEVLAEALGAGPQAVATTALSTAATSAEPLKPPAAISDAIRNFQIAREIGRGEFDQQAIDEYARRALSPEFYSERAIIPGIPAEREAPAQPPAAPPVTAPAQPAVTSEAAPRTEPQTEIQRMFRELEETSGLAQLPAAPVAEEPAPKVAPAVTPPVAEAVSTTAETAPPAPTAEKPPLLDESNVQRSKKSPEQGGRHPQVQAAAMLLEQGQMGREEYEKYVDAYKPIYPIDIDKMYPPSTTEAMQGALRGDVAKSRLNTPIADGTRVGLRMDLPALERGVPVVSIHEGKPNEDPRTGKPYSSAGDVIGYGSTGYIKDVFFAPRSQEKSLKMGYLPQGKNPLQTAEGTWVNMSPEEVAKKVQELKDDPAWTQVGFDPHRHGYFYDRNTREPVVKADEMFQIGNFLLAKNVQYAPKEQFLYNIESILDAPVDGDPDQRSLSYKREAKKLTKAYEDGKISSEQFAGQMGILKRQDDQQRASKEEQPLARGPYHIKRRLNEAIGEGWISKEAYDLTEWFINNNPRLVEGLAISLQGKGQRGVVGTYDVFNRLMILIKNKGNDNTIIHEILHHLERMMPQKIQDAIRKEWTKRLLNAQKQSKTELEKFFFDALIDHHFGENRIGDLNLAPKIIAELNKMGFDFNLDTPSSKVVKEMLKRGIVPIKHYQYYSPSEFWAVNGSDIVRGRYNAIKGGVLTRLKNWLRELGQKIKSVFGLSSDAPILRALDSLAKADGQFITDNLLDQAQTLFSIEPEAKPAPREAAPTKTIEPSKIDRERDTWMPVGRDELGRPNFGPGAKAYDLVARLANIALDKISMKPISPELSRAMRNMKTHVAKTQKEVGAIGKELAKMSPQERALISDVIEGELEAGINPPQEVLNTAAAMQSLMTKQSQELVRLGMLSKEAANRWENKYLPRFYLNKLGDETKAWASAAKRLLMKEPTMQGIKGKQLKSRGMYKAVYVEDLPEWIAEGWEQRDPSFNPKTSTETVVWRDYTREEREKMGEIRDAMFRFVMGYNASQRDIALGRLYENLAENYASKSPAEGLVQVPDTKIEGTGAYRYGKLAGLYVPKEIMDHLVWNDQEMANGLYKLYRAGLGRWKEGKTVLNPTAHVNNVFSNFTMAHFAGVSYWDVNKYAGALRDFVKKDDMLKEAEDVGLFTGTFSQAEMVENMPPELKKLANMTESQIAKYGDKAWDLLSFTLEWDGKKYGARPVMKWMYENEDFFFRYLIYRDARNRGLEPEDAREYSNQFIFTYDDLPKGARIIRDVGMPFFSYTYKVVPVLTRTALEYPWRFAAPAAAVYALNTMMYAMAASLGGDEDDWWGKVLYKYVTDEEFRNKANKLEEEERKNLPPWMKGKSSLGTEKAIRLGMDDVTGLPLFLDISRIFPGGDLLDAENNAGGVALLQPLTPSNPVFTTLVAMLANKDLFLGKDIVNEKTDDANDQAKKRAAWLWKQWAPAISVGNYHFDRAMNTIANMTGTPVSIQAGPVDVEYTGVGKDGLPVIPKYAVMQTFGVKVRPYDLETAEAINESEKNKVIKALASEVKRIDRLEERGAITPRVANIEREKLERKKELLKAGLTIEGEEKK